MKILTRGQTIPCDAFVLLDDYDNAVAVGIQLNGGCQLVRCDEPNFVPVLRQTGLQARVPKVLLVDEGVISETLRRFREIARGQWQQ